MSKMSIENSVDGQIPSNIVCGSGSFTLAGITILKNTRSKSNEKLKFVDSLVNSNEISNVSTNIGSVGQDTNLTTNVGQDTNLTKNVGLVFGEDKD